MIKLTVGIEGIMYPATPHKEYGRQLEMYMKPALAPAASAP